MRVVAKFLLRGDEFPHEFQRFFRFWSEKNNAKDKSRSQFYQEESQRPRLDEKLVYNFDHVSLRTKKKEKKIFKKFTWGTRQSYRYISIDVVRW